MDTAATRAPAIKSVAPYLMVKDIRESIAYYQKLGFESELVFGGEPPLFTIVHRGGAEIMLKRIESAGPPRDANRAWDAYVRVTGLDALYAELRASGANITCAPHVQDYGMRELEVTDIDGHVICFGEQQ